MSDARFEVSYDGAPVRDGSMDVREFAPALLALGGLIEQANFALNERRASVSVRIKLDQEPKSFPFSIEVVQGLSQASAALVGIVPTVWTAAKILEALGIVVSAAGVGVGFLQLLEMLKGKGVASITEIDDESQTVTVTGNNNQVVVAQAGAVILLNDPSVRREAEKVFRPLQRPDMDAVEFRKGDHIFRVDHDEADYFLAPPQTVGDEVDSGTFIDWVTVNKHWNTPNNKWQFVGTGGMPFNAHITDESFWEGMSRDLYAPTPHAKFKVRVEYVTGPGDDQPNCTVTDVLDYEPPDTFSQRPLELSSDPSEPSTEAEVPPPSAEGDPGT